jgi:histidine triad (HIT) family protein
MQNDCVFCKIVSGEIPTSKIYEDNEVLAFKDIHPVAPVHILIIPKKHIPRVADAVEADEKVLGKIQLVAAKIAKDLGTGDSFRISNANGENAGQSVFHVHYHLLGGWKNKTKIVYEPE